MLAFFILSAIVLLIAFVYWKHRQLAQSLPPGPPPLPILGNILQIDFTDPRKTFLEWHKKYGAIYTIWIGHKPNVFVTGHELMQEIFVKRGDEFNERPSSILLELLTHGQHGIGNTNGDKWREQRKFSMQTLRNLGSGRKIMEEKIESEISKLIYQIDSQFEGRSQMNFDLKPLKDICLCNIISSVVLGTTYEFDDKKFLELKKAMKTVGDSFGNPFISMLDSFSWLRFIPFYGRLGLDKLITENDKILDFMSAEVERHKKELGQSLEPNDFTEAYLMEMKRRQESGADMSWFNDWQLTATLFDIWTAGVDTTVTTMDWAVLLMMHFPDVQEKMAKEIINVVGLERAPTINDRSQMPYTNAVIQEIQRYGSVIVSNIGRTSKTDVDILGYKIPKGTAIVPQFPVIHIDDTIFESPGEFNPQRFLDDEKTLKKTDTIMMPFSLGKRICMGEGLARMELFLLIASLFQRYSFTFVDDEPQPALTADASGFTSRPAVHYRVCIKCRV